MIVIALRPAPGAGLCGLMVAECAGKNEIASAQAEGLRLLAAAATVALSAVHAPAGAPEKSTRRRQIDE
jgi:hypothetical protein